MPEKYSIAMSIVLVFIVSSHGMQSGLQEIRFDHIDADVKCIMDNPPKIAPASVAMRAKVKQVCGPSYATYYGFFTMCAWSPTLKNVLAASRASSPPSPLASCVFLFNGEPSTEYPLSVVTTDSPNCVAFHPSGTMLAVGTSAGV